MNAKGVVVTGSSGGIGSAICKRLFSEGYQVIGLDLSVPKSDSPQKHITTDLIQYSQNADYRLQINSIINDKLAGLTLKALINNAAVQRLGHLAEISQKDWDETLAVNVSAPMWLSQSLLALLQVGGGTIINIASIHAKLTKSQFVSYATSKAALSGLTSAMSIDIGSSVTVNSISPAAIETEMLKAGFVGKQTLYDALKEIHPTRSIGTPSDIAELVAWLVNGGVRFLNGSNIDIAGGINHCLLDPDVL